EPHPLGEERNPLHAAVLNGQRATSQGLRRSGGRLQRPIGVPTAARPAPRIRVRSTPPGCRTPKPTAPLVSIPESWRTVPPFAASSTCPACTRRTTVSGGAPRFVCTSH